MLTGSVTLLTGWSISNVTGPLSNAVSTASNSAFRFGNAPRHAASAAQSPSNLTSASCAALAKLRGCFAAGVATPARAIDRTRCGC